MKRSYPYFIALATLFWVGFTTSLSGQRCEDEPETGAFAALGFGGGVEFGIFHRRGFDEDDWERRPYRGAALRYHGFSLPACSVYGQEYQEWEEEERIVGIDLSGTERFCAESVFDETVFAYNQAFGQPLRQHHDRHFLEVERAAAWLDADQIVIVRYFAEGREQNLEVITRYIDEVGDW
ncbi:MAG: hypothetical protein AAGN35_11160 [Bacteroidota bacterium]